MALRPLSGLYTRTDTVPGTLIAVKV